MTGDLKSNILLLLALVSIGIAGRFGLKRWSHDRNLFFNEKNIEQGLNHNTSKGGVTSFTNICLGLEQNTWQGKKLKAEQLKFLQATAPPFCFCMKVQIEKSKVVRESSSTQAMTQTYLNFLKSARGQKIYDYCNQVAKFDVNRKTGRAVASLPPPPKPKLPTKAKATTQKKKSI